MGNDIFSSLFREQARVFKAAFSSVSTELFFDPDAKRLRHTGEYGTYRESIVRDFLKFIVPRSLEISTGFIITGQNDVSTQCDVIVFDPRITPLYQEGGRQRFFPVETAFCVAEVKSSISRTELSDALNKLAAIKALGEKIKNPTILEPGSTRRFDPENHPYDLVPTILLCQDLKFSLSDIENEVDALYSTDVLHRHKHNMIISIKDGILLYYDNNGKTLPYPRLRGSNLPHRFVYPGDDEDIHLKYFATYLFMLTASKTKLYPEITDYLMSGTGGIVCDQSQEP